MRRCELRTVSARAGVESPRRGSRSRRELEQPLDPSAGMGGDPLVPAVEAVGPAGPNYKAKLERAKDYIAAGDTSRSFCRSASRGFDCPFALYRALRPVNPSPYISSSTRAIPIVCSSRDPRAPDRGPSKFARSRAPAARQSTAEDLALEGNSWPMRKSARSI